MVQPLPVGNALRLFFEPPADAVQWKVLRKGSDTFSGVDDASAIVAYEGDERVVVDSAFLQNEVMAFYKPFYNNGGGWVAGPTASGTPVATYQEVTTDVLSVVRARLEAGLKVECERGNLSPANGYVQVFNASPSLERDLAMPLVTVHLENEEPSIRAIGEDISGDMYDGIGESWEESDGWLASVRLTLIGWSLNSDERIELRKCMRRVIMANMPVFADLGWEQVELSLSDIDAVNGEYPAHIYQVMGSFSCIAPTRVVSDVDSVVQQVVSRSINQ